MLFAQQKEHITVERKGLKKEYYLNGEETPLKQLSPILKSDQNSAADFNAYRLTSTLGFSSIAIGTVFIGVGFYYTAKSAQAVGENDLAKTTHYSDRSTTNILIGSGFYLLSVPFLLISNSKMKKSIELYNSGSASSRIHHMKFYLGLTGEGLGVGLRF